MSDHRFDVCIVGAGAVGLLLAALLSETKRVALFVKKGRYDELVNAQPRVSGHIVRSARNLSIFSETRDLSADSYWLCVKSHSLHDAVAELGPIVRRDRASVVCASNGFAIHEELTALLPGTPLIRLLCGFGAKLVGPAETLLAGPMSAVCSSGTESEKERAQTAALLLGIGCDCVEDDDPRRAEWRKALVNVPVNTICSILDTENGALLTHPDLRATAERMIEEVLAAAEKDGRPLRVLATDVIESVRAHAANINSTLADIRAHKPTESAAIVGRIVSAALALGTDIRITAALYSVLEARERLAGCGRGDQSPISLERR